MFETKLKPTLNVFSASERAKSNLIQSISYIPLVPKVNMVNQTTKSFIL